MVRRNFSALDTTEPVVSPADRLDNSSVWPSDLVIYFTVGAFESTGAATTREPN